MKKSVNELALCHSNGCKPHFCWFSLGSFWFLLFRNTKFLIDIERERCNTRYYINFSCGHLIARLIFSKKKKKRRFRKVEDFILKSLTAFLTCFLCKILRAFLQDVQQVISQSKAGGRLGQKREFMYHFTKSQ